MVNIKNEKCDVYCGRPTIFSNPFIIGRDGTRDDVCDKYIEYFNYKIQTPEFRKAVLSLKGKRLGCWCIPLRCHVQTILEFIENET